MNPAGETTSFENGMPKKKWSQVKNEEVCKWTPEELGVDFSELALIRYLIMNKRMLESQDRVNTFKREAKRDILDKVKAAMLQKGVVCWEYDGTQFKLAPAKYADLPKPEASKILESKGVKYEDVFVQTFKLDKNSKKVKELLGEDTLDELQTVHGFKMTVHPKRDDVRKQSHKGGVKRAMRGDEPPAKRPRHN